MQINCHIPIKRKLSVSKDEFLTDSVTLRNKLTSNPIRQSIQGAGVYAFFSQDTCLYVGKASRSLSGRVLTHLRYNNPHTRESDAILKQETKRIDLYTCKPEYVGLLECSLINELSPLYNIAYCEHRRG